MVLMGYSGARGTLIYEKNMKAKISCQTPFNSLNVITFKRSQKTYSVSYTSLRILLFSYGNYIKLADIFTPALSFLYNVGELIMTRLHLVYMLRFSSAESAIVDSSSTCTVMESSNHFLWVAILKISRFFSKPAKHPLQSLMDVKKKKKI